MGTLPITPTKIANGNGKAAVALHGGLVMNNQETIMVTAGVAGVEALISWQKVTSPPSTLLHLHLARLTTLTEVAHITGLPSGKPYKKSIKSIQKKKSIRALEH